MHTKSVERPGESPEAAPGEGSPPASALGSVPGSVPGIDPLHASKVPVLVMDASDRASPQSARIDTGGPRLGSRVAASIHGTDSLTGP